MRRPVLLALAILFASPALAAENRCGWFENPTPANAWLTDAQGQWIIASQGSFMAEGDWPSIDDWVATNGSYGYGCTCMRVTTDKAESRILEIHSSRPLPLSKCENDPALKRPE
jgi:hypothetical protein